MNAPIGKALLIGTALALALGGCAVHPDRTRGPMAAPKIVPQPSVPMPRPQPPMGAAANFTVPQRAADGRYMTPNYALSDADTLWHVRMALNVAALSCRNDPTDAARTHYIRLLSVHRNALAAANRAVDAQYRARFGGQATGLRDTHNTRAYNFFALPPVQARFCTTAIAVSAAAADMGSAELTAFAPTALAQLEQPFVEFFDAYAVYQADLARWQGGQHYAAAIARASAGLVTASATPAPPVQSRAGGYVVQLSAFRTGEAAQTIWSDLAARHRAIAGLPVVQSSAEVDGAPIYRLAVAGFETQAEASKTCAALKAEGGTCFVRARLPADAPAQWASAAS